MQRRRRSAIDGLETRMIEGNACLLLLAAALAAPVGAQQYVFPAKGKGYTAK